MQSRVWAASAFVVPEPFVRWPRVSGCDFDQASFGVGCFVFSASEVLRLGCPDLIFMVDGLICACSLFRRPELLVEFVHVCSY